MNSSPSRSDFRSLAHDHSVVPVWREVLADYTTPVAAFARLAGDGADEATAFLFESVGLTLSASDFAALEEVT